MSDQNDVNLGDLGSVPLRSVPLGSVPLSSVPLVSGPLVSGGDRNSGSNPNEGNNLSISGLSATGLSATGLSATGQLSVSVELFEGPIDLLLHLVKQQELPIELVSLAKVAEQYMQALKEMQRLDLEIAGEYLVVAATLVSVKAAVLLNQPIDAETGLDTEESLSPHEELLRRLREAAVYRDGAQQLGARDWLNIDVFQGAGVMDIDLGLAPLKPHDSILLAKALQRLVSRSDQASKLLTITVDSVSITERMIRVVDLLKLSPGQVIELDSLVDDQSLPALVGTFLALLELAKRQAIAVRQDLEFDRIFVALTDDIDVLNRPEVFAGVSSDRNDDANTTDAVAAGGDVNAVRIEKQAV